MSSEKGLGLATADAWGDLRALTTARIALGRSGAGTPTRPMLDFQLAHARARDAVHAPFAPEILKSQIENLQSGISDLKLECRALHSAATDPRTFLLRPDLGRRLDDTSRAILRDTAGSISASTHPADLSVVISDGLSALAVHRQVPPLLRALLALLARPPRGAAATKDAKPQESVTCETWRLAPIVIACRGRVAIQDEIGEVLGAQIALILIGERPGLGSPDSLGAYMVYGPRVGLTDANRNCVSNIRPEGLGHEAAARTIHYLLAQARQHRLSGVGLKDNSRLLAPMQPGLEDRR